MSSLDKDTIPGAQKLAQFEEIPCDICIKGTPTEVRPWFRDNCPKCKGTGQIPKPQLTCAQAGAIGGRATGPNKRRTRAHYRRANKIRWAKFRAEKAKEVKP